MGWIDNFTLIMKSSVTTLREKVQNPERMLHQLIVDMEEEQDRVRRSVAQAIADEIQLRKKVETARKEAEQWMERAATALRRDDEEASRSALERKVIAERRADDLDREHRKQKEQTARLQRAVGELDDKIRQARQKKTLLLARLVRADSERRIKTALDGMESRSAFAQFSRLEEKVERSEALSEAWDRMDGKDPDAEELEREFEEKERREQLDRELEELKQRTAHEAQVDGGDERGGS